MEKNKEILSECSSRITDTIERELAQEKMVCEFMKERGLKEIPIICEGFFVGTITDKCQYEKGYHQRALNDSALNHLAHFAYEAMLEFQRISDLCNQEIEVEVDLYSNYELDSTTTWKGTFNNLCEKMEKYNKISTYHNELQPIPGCYYKFLNRQMRDDFDKWKIMIPFIAKQTL